jgi:hypothetical protein
MDAGDSSYRFKPKAPTNWSVQTYKRGDRHVRLIKLKPWQILAFMALKGAALGLLRAFCGSGKTIAARSIAAYKALVTGKRQVFCVPKNDIGNDGFASNFDIEIPWKWGRKRVVQCDTPLNFCSPRSSSKIKELISLLCQDPVKDECAGKYHVLYSMQIVVTHQCLTLAIRRISKDPEMLAKFIRNNTFWIDEGHHIKGHDGTDAAKASMNFLGKFVNGILDDRRHGAELFVMTATPYRGDYSRLFSPDQMRDFTSFSLDFLEHFPTLGIEQVNIRLEEYKDIDDAVRRVAGNIAMELDKRHLVFVPPTSRKWRRNGADVDRLFDAVYKAIMEKTGCDLETAKSTVLDLVTPGTQAANMRLLKAEPKSGDERPSRFNVVVACMMCREGSDGCPADRIHNTSMEHSPPLNFQTNGRLFRSFPGKKEVLIRYYVQEFRAISAGKREFVSDRVNYILHYMLMDDMFNPIMVNIPPFRAKDAARGGTRRKQSTLEEIFHPNYQEMKDFLLTRMAEVDFTEAGVDQVISMTLEKYLPKDRGFKRKDKTQIRAALKAFLLRCRSSELRNQGDVDVSFIRKHGFDKVVEERGIGGNMYAANLKESDLRKFRETVDELVWTEEQKEKIKEGLRKIAAKRFGKRDDKDQGYLETLYAVAKDFESIQMAYKNASKTKDFTPAAVARMVNKPLDHVEKMMGFFDRFCLAEAMRFNFKKDSALARKVVPFGEAA